MRITHKLLAVALLAGALICASASLLRPSVAAAAGASLYISPPSGSFAAGDTFTVSIYLNTGGAFVNAIEADLAFPPNELQVVSPSSGKSFIQTWVVQPTYSNINGTLNFSGVVPTPGISTSAGLISTITFRVVNTGIATLKFSDTSKVLLNDGKGTDVLSQRTDGIFTLTVPPPAGPTVTSPTNPDQSRWYSTQSVVLRWAPTLPDTQPPQGYSYVMNDLPADTPDGISEGTSTFITYNHVSDGVHYFHIKSLRSGLWGGVTDFAIWVDNTPPAAFTVNLSPGAYTSNQNPIIEFRTTDAASGIDHYELKIIPLTPSPAEDAAKTTPFFIEASSPYAQQLQLGDYDVVVRAFDQAGNFYQATERLSIVTPLFELATDRGLRIGPYTLSWPWGGLLAILLLIPLVYILVRLWRLHRELHQRLERGAAEHPEIVEQLAALKAKQKEYENALKNLVVVFLLLAGSWSLVAAPAVRAAGAGTSAPSLALNPPIINLFPQSLSNKDILYLGGWANVPNANVVISIERTETGETFSGSATTGADGNWFYSFPQLLNPGHYVAWAQLKFADESSAPSSRVDVTVAPTALQLGTWRLDYQELYLLLAILFLAVVIVLLASIIYHARKFRAKRAQFREAIRAAEESVRRGFSVLRRDIEFELATVQKAKLEGELSLEEKSYEEKLLKDLDYVDRYIGKEIWRIEEEEKEL
jgi:hypothetical protein